MRPSCTPNFWNCFDISYRFWDKKDPKFIFNSTPYSVFKICHSNKFSCTRNTVTILNFKRIKNCFFAESRDAWLARCVYLRSIGLKLTVWWRCQIGHKFTGLIRPFGRSQFQLQLRILIESVKIWQSSDMSFSVSNSPRSIKTRSKNFRVFKRVSLRNRNLDLKKTLACE